MIYVLIIGFGLIAIFNIYEEWAFTWPFREVNFYEDVSASEETKRKLSKTFHYFGWCSILTKITIAAASCFFIYSQFIVQWGHFCMYWLAGFLVYVNVYHVGYALKINRDWYFLAEDHGLVELFGPYVGKYIVFVSAGLLALIIFFN